MIYKYDGRGEQCPVPLVNLRLLLKKMVAGDKCIILIQDVGSVKDIPKFLNKTQYCYRQDFLDNGSIELTIESDVIV